MHSEGDEQVNKRRCPASRPSVPAGRGGGAAGPAAGGGVPAAGGSGAGAPGPRAGATYRPVRGRAHQRRGTDRPCGAAQVPRVGRGRGGARRWAGAQMGGVGLSGGRGDAVWGRSLLLLLTCHLASPSTEREVGGKSRCLGPGIFVT